MPKGSTFANEVLKLILNNTAVADVGDASGLQPSATLGSVHLALHTADPGVGGSQNTSEAAYTGYARKTVSRGGTEWVTDGGNGLENANVQAFPACTGGSEVITHYSMGSASSGAGKIYYTSPLGSRVGAFTATDTGDLFTSPAHGLADDDRVTFRAQTGDTLPTGIAAGTVYYVISATTDTFQVSATEGGGAVALTADGAGVATKVVTLAVSSGITPQFGAGDLNVVET